MAQTWLHFRQPPVSLAAAGPCWQAQCALYSMRELTGLRSVYFWIRCRAMKRQQPIFDGPCVRYFCVLACACVVVSFCDMLQALARPITEATKEDEKVAACRWKFSHNRCSVPLNEWNHETNVDSHVLLVVQHGTSIESDFSASHLAAYAGPGGGPRAEGDPALFAAAVSARKGRTSTGLESCGVCCHE